MAERNHKIWIGLIACVIFAGSLYVHFQSDLAKYIQRATYPLQFKVRDHLGKSQSFHPKLKVYGIDDRTVTDWQSDDIPIARWGKILKDIAAQKPKAILLDKLFSHPRELSGLAEFRKAMSEIDVPVISGGFVASKRRSARSLIETSDDIYQVNSWQKEGQGWTGLRPDLMRVDAGFLYGASKEIQDSLQVGHVEYNGSGKVAAFLQLNQSEVVPHMTLLAGFNVEIRDSGIFIQGKPLPLNQGELLLNFPPENVLYDNILSLRSLSRMSQDGVSLDGRVKEGQVVLIIPMYTGSTDHVQTPIGIVPGGLVLTTLLNNLLHNDYISLASDSAAAAFLGLCVLLGLLCGVQPSVKRFGTLFPISWSLTGIAGLSVVTYFNYQLPWVLGSFNFAFCSVAVFLFLKQIEDKKAVKVRAALEGLIPNQSLNRIIDQNLAKDTNPRAQVVSIMFVDIVGFSLIAEQVPPKVVFEKLKKMTQTITKIVHKHNGVIDRTLGDGVLAYFGYDFVTDRKVGDHADSALQCAIDIQHHMLIEALLNIEADDVILPLRIGINTAPVLLGDIGSGDRFDFTVIGSGVNFAQRLEAACNDYRVVISQSTQNMLFDPKAYTAKQYKQLIQVKHQSELVEAIEYDPLHDRNEDRIHAINHYRDKVGLVRLKERIQVNQEFGASIETKFGSGTVMDISVGGMRINMNTNIGKNATFTARLRCVNEDYQQELNNLRISHLICLVKQSAPQRQGFSIGVKITNLSKAEEEALVNFFKKNPEITLSA